MTRNAFTTIVVIGLLVGACGNGGVGTTASSSSTGSTTTTSTTTQSTTTTAPSPPSLQLVPYRDGVRIDREQVKVAIEGALTFRIEMDGSERCFPDVDNPDRTTRGDSDSQMSDDGCTVTYRAPQTIENESTEDTLTLDVNGLSDSVHITVLRHSKEAIHFVIDVSARMSELFDANSSRLEVAAQQLLLRHGKLDDLQRTALRTFGDASHLDNESRGDCLEHTDLPVTFSARVNNESSVEAELSGHVRDASTYDEAPLGEALRRAVLDIPGDASNAGLFRIIAFTGGSSECRNDDLFGPLLRDVQAGVGRENSPTIELTMVGLGLGRDDLNVLRELEVVLDRFISTTCINVTPSDESDSGFQEQECES